MTDLTIIVPGVARGKGRPRFGNGRTVTDAKTHNAEAFVKLCAVQAMRGEAMIEKSVSVSVTITVPVPASWPKAKKALALSNTIRPTGKPDLDNTTKLFFDALNGVVWRDDSQVTEARLAKIYGDAPQTVITVKA